MKDLLPLLEKVMQTSHFTIARHDSAILSLAAYA